MPVISVVVPRLKTNQLRWTFTGAFEVYYKFMLIDTLVSQVLKTSFFLYGSIAGCFFLFYRLFYKFDYYTALAKFPTTE